MKKTLFTGIAVACFCCASAVFSADCPVKTQKADEAASPVSGQLDAKPVEKTMKEKNKGERKMHKSGLKCVFLICNDVAAQQKYYGETLKLKTEGSAEEGFVVVSAGVDLMFFKGDYPLPIQKEWAWQPGYEGGKADITSFSIGLSEPEFKAAYLGLQKAGAQLLKEKPEWRQDTYWGLTTKDPMGNTLEIYTTPSVKPQNPVWPHPGLQPGQEVI